MGRRKKVVDIDERIRIAEEEQALLEQQLEAKKLEVEELKNEKAAITQRHLAAIIEGSGVSLDEIEEMVKEKIKEKETTEEVNEIDS